MPPMDRIVLVGKHQRERETYGSPLPPREGSLIQMVIGSHPPFPAGSKQLSSNFDNLLFLAVFRVLNFRSHFEALNDVFGVCCSCKISL